MPRHHWLADGILLMTAIVWGANILVFKYAIHDIDPYIFNALRLLCSLVTLNVLALGESLLWPRRRAEQHIPWFRVMAFALLNGIVYLLSFVQGIAQTTAGNVALILATMPVWTGLLSYLFLHERLRRITWWGLLITLTGTVIVTVPGGGEVSLGRQYFVGNLFILLSALAWAASTVVSRGILRVLTPLQLSAISALMTTPFHLWLVANQLPAAFEQMRDPRLLAAVVFSGAFSTGIAYASWNAGVRLVGASHASVYQNVVTLVAVVGGWLLLSEPVIAAQLLGGGLTIAGLLMMRRGRRPAIT